jgi:hypothetical protein
MVRHFFFSRGGHFFLSAKTHAVRWISFIFPFIKDLYNYSGVNTENDHCSKHEAPTDQEIAKVADASSKFEKGERYVFSFVFLFLLFFN